MGRLVAVGLGWLASFGVLYLTQLRGSMADAYLADFWQNSLAPFPPRSLAEIAWYPQRAYAFFADKFGRCDQSSDEEFEPGRYRLSSCTWNNIDWSFFAPNTKQVILDVTCSRLGGPFFWFGAMPPFSCAAGVTYKRIDQYGANVTMNEGYGAATIGQRRDCAWVFGPPPELEDLEDFDFRSKMRMRRR